MNITTIGRAPNFTDANHIRVYAALHPSCGPLVGLDLDAGSLRLQHDMTPQQARDMAAMLMSAAQLVETAAAAKANDNAAGEAAA